MINYRKQSYDNVNEWVKEIQDNTDQDVIIYLVGNRVDLEEMREVSKIDAKKCVKDNQFHNYMETSALTGENVKELFSNVTKHLYIANKHKLDLFVSIHLHDVPIMNLNI